MTIIRCEFSTLPPRSDLGIAAIESTRHMAIAVELVVPGNVRGTESNENREAMYAALFGGD